MSANRKRKIRIEMHLTEDERDLFLQRMDDAGIQNMQAYLRRMALTGYILRLDLSEVRETLRLITKANININQLAKRANETHSIHARDITLLHEEVNNLRVQVSDVMKVFGRVRELEAPLLPQLC